MTISQVNDSEKISAIELCLFQSGAMVLAHSLRDNGTKKQLAALVTVNTLQDTTIEELKVRLLPKNTSHD